MSFLSSPQVPLCPLSLPRPPFSLPSWSPLPPLPSLVTRPRAPLGPLHSSTLLQLAARLSTVPAKARPRCAGIWLTRRLVGLQAYELSVLTGTQVLLLVVSETGLVYTFTTPKLQPLVTKAEGKNLIQVCYSPPPRVCARTPRPGVQADDAPRQACLNAPEPGTGNENGVDGGDQVESPEESAAQHIPPPGARPGMPQNPHMPPNYMPNMPMDAQQAMAYQSYVQQRSQGYGSGMPPQAGMPPSNHHQS